MSMLYPHGELEEAAVRWLLLERKCIAAYTERHPTGYWKPDAIGVLSSRRIIEIEVKRTVADFRADRLKSNVMAWRHEERGRPYQFYYLIPVEIASVIPEIPEWAGVIQARDQFQLDVVRRATVNNQAKRIPLKHVAKATRQQSLQVMSLMGDACRMRSQAQWMREEIYRLKTQ